MAKALKKRGHHVAVFLPPYDNRAHSGKHLRIDGIDLYNVKVLKIESPIDYLIVSARLTVKALMYKPDVIHVFKPKGYSGLAAMLLIFLRKIRLIGTPIVVDSDDWEGIQGFGAFYREHAIYSGIAVKFFDFQERWITRRVDALTVASRTLERQMNLFGVPKRKVFYIPNGPHASTSKTASFDLKLIRDKFEIDNNPLILLYTRFFEFRIEKVIELLLRVRQKLHEAKLLVVGKGMYNEETHFLEQVKNNYLTDSVIYVGWAKPEELPGYLAVADVAIYPYDDTILNRAKCPGKLVELMGEGKAVVAESVGQIHEYIKDNESGILVPPNNIEMFAEKIIEVLRNKTLRKKLEGGAKQRIWSQFNWDTMVNTIEKAYGLAGKNKQ